METRSARALRPCYLMLTFLLDARFVGSGSIQYMSLLEDNPTCRRHRNSGADDPKLSSAD